MERLEVDLSRIPINDLSKILEGYTDVYHLAAVKLHNQKNSALDLIENNIRASNGVFEACGLAGVQNVFFSSSVYSYGSLGPSIMSEEDPCIPLTQYGLSKLWGEHSLRIYAHKYGLKYIIGRLFFIYGPKQFTEGGYKSVIKKNAERVVKGESFLINGDGQQELDYLHVDDCCKIIAELMQNPINKIVNVASGKGLSINEIAKITLELNNSGAVEFLPTDWTHGTKRVANTDLLRTIIPRLELRDVNSGIRSVLDES